MAVIEKTPIEQFRDLRERYPNSRVALAVCCGRVYVYWSSFDMHCSICKALLKGDPYEPHDGTTISQLEQLVERVEGQ